MYKTIYQKQKRAKVWLIMPKLQGRTSRTSSVGCAGPELSETMNEPSANYFFFRLIGKVSLTIFFSQSSKAHADVCKIRKPEARVPTWVAGT